MSKTFSASFTLNNHSGWLLHGGSYSQSVETIYTNSENKVAQEFVALGGQVTEKFDLAWVATDRRGVYNSVSFCNGGQCVEGGATVCNITARKATDACKLYSCTGQSTDRQKRLPWNARKFLG